MANGISIHIGLNRVDPNHYQGWDGALQGCENDARDLQAIAKGQEFETSILLNEEATADSVKAAISGAASQLESGDILLLTYSGHGGQVPDPTEEEEDHYDETWVLYDRQLVDDELYALWGEFASGVRILVLSDSCHSGSVARALRESPLFAGAPAANQPRFRVMPEETGQLTYKANKAIYDQLQEDHPLGDQVGIGASVILISGCQDNQVSLDGGTNGLFTGTLLKVWNDGRFKGSHRKFHRKIQDKIEFFQSPNYFLVGPFNPMFERQRPFTV